MSKKKLIKRCKIGNILNRQKRLSTNLVNEAQERGIESDYYASTIQQNPAEFTNKQQRQAEAYSRYSEINPAIKYTYSEEDKAANRMFDRMSNLQVNYKAFTDIGSDDNGEFTNHYNVSVNTTPQNDSIWSVSLNNKNGISEYNIFKNGETGTYSYSAVEDGDLLEESNINLEQIPTHLQQYMMNSLRNFKKNE